MTNDQVPMTKEFPITKSQRLLIGAWSFTGHWLLVIGHLSATSLLANPQGMTVTHGSATATQSGPRLNVRASNGAVLDWRSFNIQPGETTTFVQPSATSIVWNRILDPNLSQVWGTI